MGLRKAGWIAAVMCAFPCALRAADDTDSLKREIQEMRKRMEQSATEVEAMKRQMSSSGMSVRSAADRALAKADAAVDHTVTTGVGKLKIGGMVQVWYSSIQNDSRGSLDNLAIPVADDNRSHDNDSFRVRRAELSFTMDVHKNATAYIMADLARGLGTYSASPTNQGFKTGPTGGGAYGGGASSALMDALINFHSFVPHHDFTVGQFLPTFSEEDYAPNSMLDFCERSFIGNTFPRDVGLNIHGSWWKNGGGGPYLGGGDSGRVQYWLTVFNGPGSYFTQPTQNQGDDNDSKDLLATVLVRPLWSDKTPGKLELGGSAGFGYHGASDVAANADGDLTEFGSQKTFATRYDAWFKYFFGGPVEGLWLKGEGALIHDRQPGGSVNYFDPSTPQVGGGHPLTVSGYWGAVGYKFSKLKTKGLRDLEVLFRYEEFDNVLIADPANTNSTNQYHTKVFTPGINYYLMGHNAKIQANYNFVDNPSGPSSAHFHNVRNDSFVVNFQVMW